MDIIGRVETIIVKYLQLVNQSHIFVNEKDKGRIKNHRERCRHFLQSEDFDNVLIEIEAINNIIDETLLISNPLREVKGLIEKYKEKQKNSN